MVKRKSRDCKLGRFSNVKFDNDLQYDNSITSRFGQFLIVASFKEDLAALSRFKFGKFSISNFLIGQERAHLEIDPKEVFLLNMLGLQISYFQIKVK